MEKYKAIRQLMAEGEFRKALDHLARILQKHPEDQKAKQLEYTCREMIHIQNACSDEPEQKNEISIEEYLSVHFRRTMKTICRRVFLMSNKLPPEWRQKIKADRFRVWEIQFTLDSDSQKDWMWELLFWDAKRRVTVLIALIAAILLCIVLFVLLVWGKGEDSGIATQKSFSAAVQAASEGNPQAQFLVGKNFYYGETVRKDVEQALFWLTKSARAGHRQAASLLQKILVEQDIQVNAGQYLWAPKDKKKNGFENDF